MSKQLTISKRVTNLEHLTVSVLGITAILTVLSGITLATLTYKKDEK